MYDSNGRYLSRRLWFIKILTDERPERQAAYFTFRAGECSENTPWRHVIRGGSVTMRLLGSGVIKTQFVARRLQIFQTSQLKE